MQFGIAVLFEIALRHAIRNRKRFLIAGLRPISLQQFVSFRASTMSQITESLHDSEHTEYGHEGSGCDCSTDNTCYIRSHGMHQQEVGRIRFRADFL